MTCRRALRVRADDARGQRAPGHNGHAGATSGATPKGGASTGSLARVSSRCAGGHLGPNAQDWGQAWQQVKAAGVSPEAAVRLGVVCDGAAGSGHHVQAWCPQAGQVLADYPCAESLHKVAKAHDAGPIRAQAWTEAPRTRLYLGQVGQVRGGLRRMQPRSAEARKARANCWVSLNDHRGRTHYRTLRRGGSPLGSGGRESANTFICHVRLKRLGAWWYEERSHQRLALRCAK